MFRRKNVLSAPPQETRVDQELKVIYGGSDGLHPDFTKLEQRRRNSGRRLLVWILLTLLVMTGAAYGGYLIFERAVSGQSQTLELTIDGPKEVKSGEEAQFDLRYQNKGLVPMANLQIKVTTPAGFTVTGSEPAATTAPNVWELGSVTAGTDGLIRLKGTWIDAVPSGATIQAVGTYRPANFSADFQEIATQVVATKESVLTFVGQGPATTTPGESVTYTYTVKNNGSLIVSDVRVRLTMPESFTVSASDPDPREEGEPEWAITSLAPGEEQTITVSGAYAADVSGLQTVHGSLGVMRAETFLEQAAHDTQSDVSGGDLTLRLIVNGSTQSQAIDPGSTLHLSIDVGNNSKETVSGLSVSFSASSPGGPGTPINWKEADVAGGQTYLNESNEIVWQGKALSQLGDIPTGGRETIDFSLPIEASVEAGMGMDELSLFVTANVDDHQAIESTPLKLTVNSDASLSAVAHYFDDGVPVGSGPLPPAVGQTTRYRLSWTLDNRLHALDEVTVSTTLPPNVTYVGQIQSTTGSLAFDSTSRVLRWTIDRLPTSIPEAVSTFDLSITPASSDLGKFVKLTNEAVFTATDSQTKSRLENRQSVLTTELPADPDASGKGAVVE